MHQRIASMERVRAQELIDLRGVTSAPYMEKQDAKNQSKALIQRATPWVNPKKRPVTADTKPINMPTEDELAAVLGIKMFG